MVLRNWYTLVELQRGTLEWDELATRFTHTFEFAGDHPTIDAALQIMKEKIFEEIPVATTNFHQCNTMVHRWMECYNVTGEPDDDDPLDINIPESERMHVVEGVGISSDQFLSPLKIKKVNIGSPKNPKFSNIEDYWDDETVGKIIEFLYEFQDLFPTMFSWMKGIVSDLGKINTFEAQRKTS